MVDFTFSLMVQSLSLIESFPTLQCACMTQQIEEWKFTKLQQRTYIWPSYDKRWSARGGAFLIKIFLFQWKFFKTLYSRLLLSISHSPFDVSEGLPQLLNQWHPGPHNAKDRGVCSRLISALSGSTERFGIGGARGAFVSAEGLTEPLGCLGICPRENVEI